MRAVVAVTGANGYVGSVIARALAQHANVVSLLRSPKNASDRAWSFAMSEQEMRQVLRSNAVTHIVHAAWDMKASSLEQLERTCVAGTKRLLDAAKGAGIRSFVFISSISAFEGTRSAYGQSKLLAEKLVRAESGTVFRLGLVCGPGNGGVFGSLVALVERFPVIPFVSGGAGLQFVIDEHSLATAVARAVRGDFRAERRILTLAHPDPIRLTDLLRAIAADRGRKVLLIPVTWRGVYLLLRAAEALRIPLRFRSDSLIGFIHQDPQPDFEPLLEHRIEVAPFVSQSQLFFR